MNMYKSSISYMRKKIGPLSKASNENLCRYICYLEVELVALEKHFTDKESAQ
jgi:hypothetical protein